MKEIYGVDFNAKITPLKIRDAILECFFEAHCEDVGLGTDEQEINRIYCGDIVKKSFEKAGANFENPTKEDLENVLKELEKFSVGFRDKNIIKKHAKQLAELLKKIED